MFEQAVKKPPFVTYQGVTFYPHDFIDLFEGKLIKQQLINGMTLKSCIKDENLILSLSGCNEEKTIESRQLRVFFERQNSTDQKLSKTESSCLTMIKTAKY